jgi:hypothetical protein
MLDTGLRACEYREEVRSDREHLAMQRESLQIQRYEAEMDKQDDTQTATGGKLSLLQRQCTAL